MVDNFRSINSNYKRQYFFLGGECLELYFLPIFDERFTQDRKFIDVIYNIHKLSNLKHFHLFDETTELSVELSRIQSPSFSLIDWVIFLASFSFYFYFRYRSTSNMSTILFTSLVRSNYLGDI